MPRPIVWAMGTLVTVAASAAMTGERFAGYVGLRESARRPQAQMVADENPVVTVTGDLMGHFVVHPTLDGRRLRMLVDTGATVVALSFEDARAAGIQVGPRDFTRTIATANGAIEAAPVRIGEIRLGDIVVRNVDALVLPRGRLTTSLLGMSFLKRLDSFEISRGQLTLRG
jgi:aspartyl protease family protein